MRMTRGGGAEGWSLGRRLSAQAAAMAWAILISIVWAAVSDWAPIESLSGLVRWPELTDQVLEMGARLARLGLVKVGLPRAVLDGACAPEA